MNVSEKSYFAGKLHEAGAEEAWVLQAVWRAARHPAG